MTKMMMITQRSRTTIPAAQMKNTPPMQLSRQIEEEEQQQQQMKMVVTQMTKSKTATQKEEEEATARRRRTPPTTTTMQFIRMRRSRRRRRRRHETVAETAAADSPRRRQSILTHSNHRRRLPYPATEDFENTTAAAAKKFVASVLKRRTQHQSLRNLSHHVSAVVRTSTCTSDVRGGGPWRLDTFDAACAMQSSKAAAADVEEEIIMAMTPQRCSRKRYGLTSRKSLREENSRSDGRGILLHDLTTTVWTTSMLMCCNMLLSHLT